MRIGELLRYARPYSPQPATIDGLPNYFSEVIIKDRKLPLLEAGINSVAEIKGPEGFRRPLILIASSPHKIGHHETPWQDVFDVDIGHIRYFGDNKTAGADPSLARGNGLLLEQLANHTSPAIERRITSVPLVFFKRVPFSGKQKGHVQFQGFGIVTGAERITQFHPKTGDYFSNYVFDFCVFSMAAESEQFDWDWIRARYDGSRQIQQTLASAPEAWREWMEDGPKSIERCRRSVSKLATVPAKDQRPPVGGDSKRDLQTIYSFYEGKKHCFEGLASAVTASIIKHSGAQYREGWLTPRCSDGGADFIGRLDVGTGLALTKIIVLGQAKCESLDSATGGNHIARTVARLRRGWIGVYVTTSYFSEAVQREIIEDKYPIMLINGLQLAQEARMLAFEGGFSNLLDYLLDLEGRYVGMVAKRQPEEVLWV